MIVEKGAPIPYSLFLIVSEDQKIITQISVSAVNVFK
jgi:hypothetical protein